MAENKQPELVEEDCQPIKQGNKYSLVDTPFSNGQIEWIFSKTPTQHKHQRPGKGGGQWDYVTGTYVKKALSFLFGFLWNFEIIDKGDVKVGNKVVQVWVQGKLTVLNSKTYEPLIIKTQFGGADVKYKKGNSNEPLDYANDLKAATTDCLKKCASELGIASDVYGKNEFKEIKPDAGQNKKPEATGKDYVEELNAVLEKRGAKTKNEKIDLYNKVTGNNIKSLNIAQSTAKKYLIEFLSSPMGK